LVEEPVQETGDGELDLPAPCLDALGTGAFGAEVEIHGGIPYHLLNEDYRLVIVAKVAFHAAIEYSGKRRDLQ
jgi:hypothetical protein